MGSTKSTRISHFTTTTVVHPDDENGRAADDAAEGIDMSGLTGREHRNDLQAVAGNGIQHGVILQRVDVAGRLESPEQTPSVLELLDRFVDKAIDSHREDADRVRLFLKKQLADVIGERNRRAEDIRGPRVRRAAETANRLFGIRTFYKYCVDGRVNPALMFGIVGGVRGGRLESPAGDSNDFVRSKDAQSEFDLVVRSGSAFETLLRTAMENNPEKIAQVLDSHCGCAAKEGECARLAKKTNDKGLRRDVLRKKGMARAIERWAKENFAARNGRPVMALQTSFDPHHGDLYMGLETDDALACSSETDYTHDTLADLVKDGKIISTRALAGQSPFREAFTALYASFDPKPDWSREYPATAEQFWQAMDQMAGAERESLLEGIKERLTGPNAPYPGLKDVHELHHRALLLLCNAFNYFCNNQNGGYQFGEHEEPFVEMSQKRFGPFERNNGFGVAIHHPRRAHYVAFSASIVRSNRTAERISSDLYASPQEFARAPVPVIIKEVVAEDLSEAQWNVLRRAKWDFLDSIEWRTMADGDFRRALVTHGINVSLATFDAINRLREASADLYNPKEDTESELLNGSLFALPVLGNQQRGIEVVVPFMIRGY